MARIEARLAALDLILPGPFQPPPGVVLPFQFVRVGLAELPFGIAVEIEAEVEFTT